MISAGKTVQQAASRRTIHPARCRTLASCCCRTALTTEFICNTNKEDNHHRHHPTMTHYKETSRLVSPLSPRLMIQQQTHPHLPRRFFSTSTTTTTTTTSLASLSEKDPVLVVEQAQAQAQAQHAPSPPPAYLTELQSLLPHVVDISVNPYERDRHGRGESHHPSRPPDVVVYPHSTHDVQDLVRFCVARHIPLIPFGAGTSVEGHVQALQGGISLDMMHFQDMELPDITSMIHHDDASVESLSLSLSSSSSVEKHDMSSFPDPLATVGAGVTRLQLNETLRHTGYYFSVDPGANATLGGMVATGASGTSAVRFGGMRDNIVALECVLPNEDATVVQCGTRASKNSAGYDLVSLLCGSEGTLAVITKITVRLRPVPQHVLCAICQFETVLAAAQAVAMIQMMDLTFLSRCELLDTASVEAWNAYNHNNNKQDSRNPDSQATTTTTTTTTTAANNLLAKPTLFFEFQGPSETALQEQVEMTESICVGDDGFGGSSFTFASDAQERQELWSARHSLMYAATAMRPGATRSIITDACVPLSRFAELISETSKDVQELGVVGPCFGHAGDGNLHCILPVRPDEDEDYLRRVFQVNDNLIQRTLAAGGTCTGEHGVGYGKIPYLERQYGPGAVHMMQLIKKSIDPHNIMNPGKVVPLSLH